MGYCDKLVPLGPWNLFPLPAEFSCKGVCIEDHLIFLDNSVCSILLLFKVVWPTSDALLLLKLARALHHSTKALLESWQLSP